MSKNRVWRGVLIALSVTAVLILFSYIALWDHYCDTLPRSPDKATGAVYVDNFHGVAVYETRDERFRLHTLGHAAEILIVLALVGGVLLDQRIRHSRGSG